MMATGTTVVMVCPACEDWQLDYTNDDLATYVHPFTDPEVAAAATVARLDALVFDHLRDCFGLPA